MANSKKTIATARAKVAEADAKAFQARFEEIEAILQGAAPHDVMTLCAHALAAVAPNCCEAHQDEFKAAHRGVLRQPVPLQRPYADDRHTHDNEGQPPPSHLS